jgi:hypothetical protein
VSFASDNPAIASVSTDGHVTAVTPGLTVVRATVEGKVGTANISVSARPAAQLDFQTEPGTGAAGAPLAPVRIEVQNDQGGTVTIGTIPVTIELAGNPTGAVLSGTRTVNALNGVASFTDLTVNQAGIGYTLRATSGTLNPAESAVRNRRRPRPLSASRHSPQRPARAALPWGASRSSRFVTATATR